VVQIVCSGPLIVHSRQSNRGDLQQPGGHVCLIGRTPSPAISTQIPGCEDFRRLQPDFCRRSIADALLVVVQPLASIAASTVLTTGADDNPRDNAMTHNVFSSVGLDAIEHVVVGQT